ncbi:MAG: tetratricopeptide repeat protein [Planctomycetota bacterium]|nr:tetratricopeptide repeat protein [Planctomycetota bacterium]
MTSHQPFALRLITGFALALTLGAPVATAQGRIDVLNNNGEITPLAGATVIKETLDSVQYTRTGSQRTESRPADRVIFIDYGKGSEAFESAQRALSLGDTQNAINLFSTATRDEDPGWVAAHAILNLAEAQAQEGKVDDARASVQRFLDEHPEHRLLPRALLLSARYASATGDAGLAQSEVDRVQQMATTGKITADWSVRAKLEHGQNLLDAGQFDEAGAAFGAAVAAARNAEKITPDRPDLATQIAALALQARSGSGAALLAAGDLATARSFFDTLERDGQDNPAIRAAALNGKAEADFLENGRMREAQLGFARVAVIGTATPDQHAKALYYFGRCCEALGEQGVEPNGRARAYQYYKDVEQRYPGTRWARMARESLP